MTFSLLFTDEASRNLDALQKHPEKLRRVRKYLAMLEQNPQYPGLRSHKYSSKKGPADQEVWESYVENNTPAAWRVFWCYGPEKSEITIIAITPHP